jgi:pyrroline-5-carboxylate reductase
MTLHPLQRKIGFFGAGRMATALARGILDAGLCKPEELSASDVDARQADLFSKEVGAKPKNSNLDLAAFADVGILAVKPGHVQEVLQEVKKAFAGKLLISIAAGVTLKTLESLVDPTTRVVRVMPNTPALVRAGASAFAAGNGINAEDIKITESILGAVGLALQVPEKMLDAVTGLSGSGPAYIFLTIEALADGGVEMGIPRDIALKLAAQTVLGSAQMVLQTGRHPGELKDMVTSPGGTTIEGLHALETGSTRAAFMNAVRAATEKSKKLAGG